MEGTIILGVPHIMRSNTLLEGCCTLRSFLFPSLNFKRFTYFQYCFTVLIYFYLVINFNIFF